MLELFRRIVILIEAMPYLHYIKNERMQEDRICGKSDGTIGMSNENKRKRSLIEL